MLGLPLVLAAGLLTQCVAAPFRHGEVTQVVLMAVGLPFFFPVEICMAGRSKPPSTTLAEFFLGVLRLTFHNEGSVVVVVSRRRRGWLA